MKKRIFSILLSIGLTLTLLPGTVLADDTSPGYRYNMIDNTLDMSVSKIIGNVRLTGTGGKQAGYYEGKTVYEEQISVTYSEPRTAAVEEKINAARTIVDNLAKDVKDRGKKGEYHRSVGTSTSAYWDHRTYSTLSYDVTAGPEGVISPGIAVEPVEGKEDTYKDSTGNEYTIDKYQITCMGIAFGNYGKETIYKVEANGYVEGYDITTAADPADGGTATSDLTASLSGETVTFTATPADGYEFHHWEVVDSSGKKQSGNANYSYTMPASDVTATAVFAPVQINLCTSRSDGGVLKLESTDGFNDDAWMTNMAVESGSQVTMVAEPDEGYEFAGYYEGIRQMDPSKEGYGFVTDYDPDKLISSDKNYTFTVTEDTNVYALFKKTVIDKVEITVEAPVCGTEITTPDEEDPWSQTNPPSVSVPDGAGYKLNNMYGGAPAIWVNSDPNYEPFEGTMKGGETYLAQIMLVPDSGVAFSENVEIVVNGGTLVDKDLNESVLAVFASVTAEHNWGEWIVDKEATEKEEGLRHRICSGCGEKEEAVIPKTEKKSDVVPGGDTAKKGTGVKTGDNANTVLYMGLGIAALLIIAVTLILLKRRERQEQ